MTFIDKAVDAYAGHPAHQEILTWLLPLVEPIKMDFASQVTA